MNANGQVFETRVFKDNPQLAKVEMLWISTTDKRVKIYLRNGKTVQSAGDRIDNLTTVSASVLLDIAGVKPRDGNQPDRKKGIQ